MSDEQPADPRRARTIKSFDGVPDGLVIPKTFNDGDEVQGDLAAVAVREGWAEPLAGFDAPAAPDLQKLKKADLIAYAKETFGLDLDEKLNKDELIAEIEAAAEKV